MLSKTRALLSRSVERLVPARHHALLLRLRGIPARLIYRGNARYCPVCESSLRTFLPHGMGSKQRPQALCPVCFSLERHRAAWALFRRHTDLFDGRPKRMLHFAPEPAFQARLRRLPELAYVTADLDNPRADVKVDITDIQYPAASFDVIYCSHVLEHVAEDGRAMRELHRVLKPDGWALLVVPVTADRTIEDPTVTDPAERLRRYGQEDHVRRYGPDFQERLEDAGFTVTAFTESEAVGEENAAAYGVSPQAPLYYCTKEPR